MKSDQITKEKVAAEKVAAEVAAEKLVSIIMPCYNGATFIAESIQSVLNQTYKNFELIIIDDGSTDNSKEIIQSFVDSRIRCVFQKNKGPSAARNTGLDNSKGFYISFLDFDDLFLHERLQGMVLEMEDRTGTNSEIDALFCYSDHFYDSDPERITHVYIKNKYSTTMLERLKEGNIINMNTALIRRNVLPETLRFDESLFTSEDWDFWIRLALSGARMQEFSQTLVLTRLRDSSIRSDIVLQKKTDIFVYKKNFESTPPLSFYWRYFLVIIVATIPFSLRAKLLNKYRNWKVYAKNNKK